MVDSVRNYSSLIKRLAIWLKRKVKEAHRRGAVVGISGGVDSAVTARLCQKALGKNVLGLILPCHSSPADSVDARLIARMFKIKTKSIDLTKVFNTLGAVLPRANPKARANIKPRLRMLVLYYFANKLNYLVVGTDNKTEFMTGYFTKYGDGGVDLLPLGGLLKSEVSSLAHYLGIPPQIIDKPPSAGLWPGQTDEGELGISYPKLDAVLRSGATKDLLVKRLIQSSAHKRELPKIFPVDAH